MKQCFCCTLCMLGMLAAYGQLTYFVSIHGKDANAGTKASPFRTVEYAVDRALTASGKDVVIEIRAGIYDLQKTITIAAQAYRIHSLIIRAWAKEKVTITGARRIQPAWQPYRNGILKAHLPLDEIPDRLFMNGKPLPMARYPNYDSAAGVFNGTAADAFSTDRVKHWRSPAGGYIHALHNGEWGDFHYRITGKTAADSLLYEGGWQNNRPAPMHRQHRFVENIFEELDAPGEWFYDTVTATLYLYPPNNTTIQKAIFSVSRLTDLLHITGNSNKPVKNISISNIAFTQNSRSFMYTKEPLLRSDWTIYRGAAILLQGTENINISHCRFTALGGNAVFMSNYNKNNLVKDNHIDNIGASAIAFVGNPAAVRSPAFRYEFFVPWNAMDYTPGPLNNDFPQYCSATGNLIHDVGQTEKQVAGVQIEMAAHIAVSHNTIYNTPRAGINIGDGCWGGHELAFNDVFNTVLETGDHGAFNSWGRDRFWRPERNLIDSIVAARPGIELLDVIDPIIIRNNRFQCDHGWDIDLDDGSSNYRIYNNICLSGGLKLREGYHRAVTNNILVNNTFHPHVWLQNSEDVFTHNIVTSPYAPILISSWGKEVDSNFFLSSGGLSQAQAAGTDRNSTWGNAFFVNAADGDFHVSPGSPVLKTGFTNFDMNVGVNSPDLKKIAARPVLKPLLTAIGQEKGAGVEWLGATCKNIETLGERSAAGLHDDNGALLTAIAPSSIAASKRLQKGDVIIALGGQVVSNIADLLKIYQQTRWMGRGDCIIIRNQQELKMTVFFKKE